MTDRILQNLRFPASCTFDDYCNAIDKFLAKESTEKKKLAFHLHDFNGDGKICLNDAYDLLAHTKQYDYMII